MKGLVGLVALFGLAAAGVALPPAHEQIEVSADAYGPDMWFFHRRAQAYSAGAPGARGIIPASTIVAGAPADYVPRVAWSTRIDSNADGSRRVTTYPTDPLPFPAAALARTLSSNSRGYAGAGVARGGVVQTPRGTSTMVVPASIPDGTAVIVTILE